VKRFLCMAFVVVTALSLGTCTSTTNTAAARETATKLTCNEVNSAIANQRTDTYAQWTDTLQSIVVNAKRSDNASLMTAASRSVGGPSHGQANVSMNTTGIDLVGFLRACDSLGLGATF
jgi:hypothetical protein